MSQQLNLVVDANTDFSIELDWVDISTNLPIDITDFTARMQIRARPFDETVLLELTTENGGIEIEGGDGKIFLFFTPIGTNLKMYTAFYDLYIKDANDRNHTRVVNGFMTILPQVTQDAAP